MWRLTLATFLFSASSLVFGQGAKAHIDLGDKEFTHGNVAAALLHYKAAEKLTPDDHKLLFKIGATLLASNKKWEALDFLEKAHQGKHDNPEIDFYLGQAYQQRLMFDKALEHFHEFRKKHKRLSAIADQHIEECILGKKLIQTPTANSVKVLDWPVNSIYNDFSPLLDSGETTLIFTSARDTTHRDSRGKKEIFESIYVSEQIAGNWTEPKELSSEVNHESHDAATYLSPDGTTMVVYYGHERDLFTSKLSQNFKSDYAQHGIWVKPEPMPFPINNSATWESSGSFSPDGQYFFFSSDRSEGYGELDLYMVKKQPDGTWGKPQNLGPEINTPANEDAPYMHIDGTLYFGSEGHAGLGNYDIYKTRFIGNKFMKPTNMGFPINTPEYDNYFHMSPDKRHGYFTSVRKEGIGGTDIFFATFPEFTAVDSLALAFSQRADSLARADSIIMANLRKASMPDSLLAKNAAKADSIMRKNESEMMTKAEFHVATEFRGRVVDEDNGKPLHAQIVLIDNKTNKILSRAHTNPKNGVFIIIIPHGGNYGLSANCDGYLFTSMNFEVPAFASSQTIETAIFMAKAEVGSKAILKNIFFDSGKSEIRPESQGELNRLVELLRKNSTLRVHINGHTDNSGDKNTNKILSQKRAQSVVDYLVNNGIASDRLKAVGFGQEKPLVSNDDEKDGREINRRTEIEVVE